MRKDLLSLLHEEHNVGYAAEDLVKQNGGGKNDITELAEACLAQITHALHSIPISLFCLYLEVYGHYVEEGVEQDEDSGGYETYHHEPLWGR